MEDATAYSVYYWPVPFRGVFARLPLAFAGATFDDKDAAEITAIRALTPEAQPFPVMAPPMLADHERDVFLNQMPALVFYLGTRLGLMPSDIADQAKVLKLVCDCNDVLAEITRANGAQMWTPEAWTEFANHRFARWLRIFESTGSRHGLRDAEGTFLGTPSLGIADLCVFALWGTMRASFVELDPLLREHAPRVMSLCDRIEADARVATFVATQSARYGTAYCGGQIEASIRAVLKTPPLNA